MYVCMYVCIYVTKNNRSRRSRCLRRVSAAARLLGLWVRIPPWAWMSVCCECLCYQVSASGWSLEQRSHTACGVSRCDHEALIMSRPWPTRGCCTVEKNGKLSYVAQSDSGSESLSYGIVISNYWRGLSCDRTTASLKRVSRVLGSASSFKFQKIIFILKLSVSCLSLLPPISVSFLLPSTTCFST